MNLYQCSMPWRSMLWLMVLLVEGLAFGQGTLVFDQRSSTDKTTPSGGTDVHLLLPYAGQSFTPAF